MVLLHLMEQFAPVGGAEQYVFNLMPHLAEAGVENVVAFRQAHPQAATSGDIRAVPAADAGQLAAVVERERPEAIYIHAVRDFGLMQAAAGLAPSVAYVHDFGPLCPGLAKYYRRGRRACARPFGLGCVPNIYNQRCATARRPDSVARIMLNTRRGLSALRQMDHLLVASTYMRNLLVQNGVPAGQASVLPHFAPEQSEAAEETVTGNMTGSASAPIILFAGRLEDEKGLPYLLRALAGLTAPFRLLVAGDGGQRAAYQNLAQSLGIARSVAFQGWMDQKEIARAYQMARMVILPSVWPEPFGMVGTEAMAHGRPVVAFDSGGIRDWLQDGQTGFLVPAHDVGRLRNAIASLLNDPALADHLGQNGRRHVARHHSPARHVSGLLAVLEEVAGQARAA